MAAGLRGREAGSLAFGLAATPADGILFATVARPADPGRPARGLKRLELTVEAECLAAE